MKCLSFSVLFFISLLSHSQEIAWKTNIEDGIKIGKTSNKEVLIYFGMDKCVPCRMIEKYAFVDPEFIEYSEKYVMVKVYDDLDKSNKALQDYIKNTREEYTIESVPTIVILKEDGSKSSFFAYVGNSKELIDMIESQY